jgi:hypothetical protein
MNNRMGMALALGGGYVLGRTKKARLALGVGSMVLGKRLGVSPKALGEFAAARLRDNPQLGELGAELRQQVGGAGKAVTSALATRQLGGLADRLHARTLGLRDRLEPGAPGRSRKGGADDTDDIDEAGEPGEYEDADEYEDAAEADDTHGEDSGKSAPARRPAARKTAKQAPAKAAGKTAQKATAKAPAGRRSGARKEPAAKEAAVGRKQSAGRTSSARSARSARRTRAEGGGRD